MADYGLKVSEGGEDVVTATDKQLAFSTEFNQFKIHAQGTFTVVVPQDLLTGSRTISHSLGYTPSFIVFLEEVAGDGKKRRIDFRGGTNRLYAEANTSNLIITVDYPLAGTPHAAATHNGYYFIFKDNLT